MIIELTTPVTSDRALMMGDYLPLHVSIVIMLALLSLILIGWLFDPLHDLLTRRHFWKTLSRKAR